MAHARAPDVDPAESQLLEERTLVNERQNRDVVASVAKRRNELRPLPLGAADIQAGANEQNLVAYHGCDRGVTSPSTARPGLSRLHAVRSRQRATPLDRIIVRIMQSRSPLGRTVAPASTLSIGVTTVSIGLSHFVATTIVRSNALSSVPLLALLALALVTILLSIPPAVVFVGWLALAPLLQNSASHTAVGHPLQLALYLLPPLVFLLWSLTASSRSRSASFIDFVPLAYFLLLLGSMFFTSDVTFPVIKDLYTIPASGSLPTTSSHSAHSARTSRNVWLRCDDVSDDRGAHEHRRWLDEMETLARHLAVRLYGGNIARSCDACPPGVLGSFIGIGVVLAIALLVWRGAKAASAACGGDNRGPAFPACTSP